MNKMRNQKTIFAGEIERQMRKNKDIWVLTGDLGYGMWDEVRKNYPERFINCGASEQAMLGMAIGIALSGKIPIVYSITPFLLFRPFETIRNYIDREQIPVKMIGSGRDKDYENEGFSHWAEEDRKILKVFKNIKAFWPKNEKEVLKLSRKIISDKNPWYLNLKKR